MGNLVHTEDAKLGHYRLNWSVPVNEMRSGIGCDLKVCQKQVIRLREGDKVIAG
jgi:hypothetical protein